MASQKGINKVHRKSFDSTVILISWSIWLERNARTFNREEKTIAQLVHKITEEACCMIDGDTKAGPKPSGPEELDRFMDRTAARASSSVNGVRSGLAFTFSALA
uniref:Uncharacterized protein n=1 Tax=Setaria italica TaxID=4555 RepID=K3ZFC5_SETIT